MDRHPKVPDPVRRGLLTGGAITLAASAVIPGRTAEAATADKEPPPQDPTRLTYRVTEHIAAYYRRARG